MTTLEKLRDLQKQATTETSHYYVASVVQEAIDEITLLDGFVTRLIGPNYKEQLTKLALQPVPKRRRSK